jgi:hypothetical protein
MTHSFLVLISPDLSEKKDRARVLAVALGLKSSFRWCLSGTPPHENFIDVQSLANLLGIHLGVNEVLPGTKLSKRGAGEESGLEKLSAFLEQRSLQWHETRHQVAQGFLDRFVRQNIAEIDEIKCEEHVSVAPCCLCDANVQLVVGRLDTAMVVSFLLYS